MTGNSPIRYGKVERALKRGGAILTSVKGSHHSWAYGRWLMTLPVHKNHVKQSYITRLRKTWRLTRKDGVSDKDFWNGDWDKEKEPSS